MTVSTEKPEITIVQRVLWVCNTLFHNLVAIVTFFMLYILFKYNNVEAKILWHAFWSTIAVSIMKYNLSYIFGIENSVSLLLFLKWDLYKLIQII